jgi:hypothetical protein
MKEQDIRRIIGEVCEALDARRARLGPLAIGAAMAMACGGSVQPKYMADTSTSTIQSDAEADTGLADAAADAPAMHYAAQFEAASDTLYMMEMAYWVPMDTATDTADTSYWAPDIAPSYTDVFTPPIDSASDGDATDGDGDAPIDTGAVMRYAVLTNSQTSQNEGG